MVTSIDNNLMSTDEGSSMVVSLLTATYGLPPSNYADLPPVASTRNCLCLAATRSVEKLVIEHGGDVFFYFINRTSILLPLIELIFRRIHFPTSTLVASKCIPFHLPLSWSIFLAATRGQLALYILPASSLKLTERFVYTP